MTSRQSPEALAAENARIDAYVARIVANFPAFTEEQLDTLAALLGDVAPERRTP